MKYLSYVLVAAMLVFALGPSFAQAQSYNYFQVRDITFASKGKTCTQARNIVDQQFSRWKSDNNILEENILTEDRNCLDSGYWNSFFSYRYSYILYVEYLPTEYAQEKRTLQFVGGFGFPLRG